MDPDVLVVVVGLGLLYLWVSTTPDDTSTITIPTPVGPIITTLPISGPAVPQVLSAPSPATAPAPIVSTGAGDQIDPGSVQVVNSPDFRGWPIAGKITSVVVSPDNVQIFTDGVSGWPHVFPDGIGDNGISFTVWAFLNINGQWVGSGFLQGVDAYKSSDGVGDGMFDWVNNWWYSSRWAPMTGHQLAPGEMVGIMLGGGSQRDNGGPDTQLRTQIVAIPATDSGTFNF